MRVTLLFALFSATIVVSVDAGAKNFNLGGWTGVVESFGKIDGVESENHDEISSKAEQTLKKIIEKHLAGKKQAKQQARKAASAQQQPMPAAPSPPAPPQQQQQEQEQQQQPPLTAPTQQQMALPASINWDEHKETREVINQKVPGGTAAVDALIKLLHEGQISQ